MDQAVIKYYRQLLKTGFRHNGSLEKPSIFLDTVSENIPICGNIGDYLHLYVNISEDLIVEIKYLCTCDPTSNVAIEIFCELVEGKTIEEFKTIREDAFDAYIEPLSDDLRKKARGLIDLLERGINRNIKPGLKNSF